MDTFTAIHTRRSIRKFEDKPVPADMVDKLIRAAMQGPSAGNEQSWAFVIVNDKAMLETLSVASPHSGMCKAAPLVIAVCGDLRRERHAGYWVQDCSIASQNILLAAHALGLGAVWVGIHPVADRILNVKAALALPEPVIPLALIPVGYPVQNIEPADRYNAQYVHHGVWRE